MADGYIQVAADGAGKKMQTYNNNVGVNDVHAEAVVLVDSSSAPITSFNLTNTVGYKTAFFNAAADGDIVAAVANKVIKVHAVALQSAGTVTINIRTDDASGTILSSWTLQAREGAVLPLADSPAYWFKTTAGEALYCDVTAAVNVTLNVIYTDSDAS